MRHFCYLIVTLGLLLPYLPGCNSQKQGPREITLHFLNAIQKSNYDEAKQFATKDSKDMLDALASFQKMLPESSQEKFKNGKISIIDVKKNDSLAVVSYNSDKDTARKTLKLKKQKDGWKVAFTKEAILPNLNAPLTPPDSIPLKQNNLPVPKDS